MDFESAIEVLQSAGIVTACPSVVISDLLARDSNSVGDALKALAAHAESGPKPRDFKDLTAHADSGPRPRARSRGLLCALPRTLASVFERRRLGCQ